MRKYRIDRIMGIPHTSRKMDIFRTLHQSLSLLVYQPAKFFVSDPQDSGIHYLVIFNWNDTIPKGFLSFSLFSMLFFDFQEHYIALSINHGLKFANCDTNCRVNDNVDDCSFLMLIKFSYRKLNCQHDEIEVLGQLLQSIQRNYCCLFVIVPAISRSR